MSPPTNNGNGKKKGKATQNLNEIRFRKQFVRTQMCSNFTIGLCERGKQCLFAHSPKEIRSRPCLNKTKMCPMGEECTRRDKCLFAHNREELVSTTEFTKTKLCHFGERCLQKENCRYAHALSELRKIKRKNTPKSESKSNNNNDQRSNDLSNPQLSQTLKRVQSENGSEGTLPSGAFQAIKMAYLQMRQQELLSQQQTSINFNNLD